MRNDHFTHVLTPEKVALSPPVRGKFTVLWQGSKDEIFTTDYVADTLCQVFERVNSQRLRLFPFVRSISLSGFYVYGEFYDWETLEECPLDIEILLYCLK